MVSNPKKQNNIADNDRLSSLPDGILIYMLSFIVPTKYAARTSILSKRWRDLFVDVSRIHLDDSLRMQNLGKTYDEADFTHFINRIITLGTSSPIHEFRLKCLGFSKDASSYINVWLAVLLRRGIEALEIEGQACNLVVPPAGFFQSKTLVVLKLHGGDFSFGPNESVCFSNLKVLSLQSLNMHLKSKTLRISDQGYPRLEDLSLKELRYPNNQSSIEISLNTLKKLEIINLYPSRFTRIDVDTPHLQQLKCYRSPLSLKICGTLESAAFIISSATGFEGQTFIETLRSINNVKVLCIVLHGIPEEFRVHFRNSLPQFPYLFHLELRHALSSVSKEFLWVLLHGAPNLRTLVFNMDGFGEYMLPSTIVPPCLGRNLVGIGLRSFKGTDAEFALVEWLLNQGAVLQVMRIDLDRKQNGDVLNHVKIETMNRLVKMGKLNPKCEVNFTLGK